MVQYQANLDAAFAAIADPTRRGILERLGRGDASISELAGDFAMTLTGIKKHVSILEDARLVTSEKQGRVRSSQIPAWNRLFGVVLISRVASTTWVASCRRI